MARTPSTSRPTRSRRHGHVDSYHWLTSFHRQWRARSGRLPEKPIAPMTANKPHPFLSSRFLALFANSNEQCTIRTGAEHTYDTPRMLPGEMSSGPMLRSLLATLIWCLCNRVAISRATEKSVASATSGLVLRTVAGIDGIHDSRSNE